MMKIFDKSGLLYIPKPKGNELCKAKKILVVNDCYCPNGHRLISSRTKFGNYEGILLKVRSVNGNGQIALSPIFGDKSRISIDVDLQDGELLEIGCPVCDATLPVYGKCECGGDLKVTLRFLKRISTTALVFATGSVVVMPRLKATAKC